MGFNKNNLSKKQIINQLLLWLFFGIVSFLFLLHSPLHIWRGADSGIDSSVFKTVAMMMDNGYMPYTDTFDHKGPYLYLLNWIGMQISYYRGVWVIEFINIFITLIALYKIARLKCNPSTSIVSVMVSISLLFTYFQDGNFVEEYAMSLIAVSLFIFLDYLINGSVDRKRLIICGLCFGGVLLLRPNMIAVWIVFCLAIFFKSIAEKKYCELRDFIIFFMIGMCIICVPFVVWLMAKGAFQDFWNSYIVFNVQYSSWVDDGSAWSYRWEMFFRFFNKQVLVLTFVIAVYLCSKKEKFIHIMYVCYCVLTLALVSLSGRMIPHYGMIMIPMITYPIASLFESLEKEGKTLVLLASLYFLSVIVMPDWLTLTSNAMFTYENRNENNHSEVVTEVCEVVEALTTPEDRISVYGNWDVIYVLTNRMHATKYSYQKPIGVVDSNIMKEYLEQLKEELPKVIVIKDESYDENIAGFLENNDYEIVWQEPEEAMIYQYSKGNN